MLKEECYFQIFHSLVNSHTWIELLLQKFDLSDEEKQYLLNMKSDIKDLELKSFGFSNKKG